MTLRDAPRSVDGCERGDTARVTLELGIDAMEEARAHAAARAAARASGRSAPRLQPFNDLKLDPWTLQGSHKLVRTTSTLGQGSLRTGTLEDASKPVAHGFLFLWHSTSLRFFRVECTIAKDLDGLWCLWGG